MLSRFITFTAVHRTTTHRVDLLARTTSVESERQIGLLCWAAMGTNRPPSLVIRISFMLSHSKEI